MSNGFKVTIGNLAITDPDFEEIVEDQDFDGTYAGNGSTSIPLYISHNSTSSITGCGLFMQAYTGADYSGVNGPTEDYNDILAWGDAYNAGGEEGGFQIDQDNDEVFESTIYTGNGTLAVPISLTAGANPGIIAADEEVHIDVRIFVPASETSARNLYIDFGLKYTYTS